MNNKLQNVLMIIVFMLVIAAMVITLAFFLPRMLDAKRSDAAAKDVEQQVFRLPPQSLDTSVSDNEIKLPTELFDYKALKEINDDCIGWIRVDGTDISYPVMWKQGDNTYYLRHDIYRNPSSHGVPYVDGGYTPDGQLIIYGHNMRDGQMFHTLTNFTDDEFFRSYGEIELYIRNEYHIYQVFAVCRVSAESEGNYYNIPDTAYPDELQEYIDMVCNKSILNAQRPLSPCRLLALSTCEYSQRNGRLLVVAVETTNSH